MGWVSIDHRCFYFSDRDGKFTHNWTEADETCKSMHSGATLAAIRSYGENENILGEAN